MNLSKSGVGASIGFRGLRVGTGGLSAGKNGFYYRNRSAIGTGVAVVICSVLFGLMVGFALYAAWWMFT